MNPLKTATDAKNQFLAQYTQIALQRGARDTELAALRMDSAALRPLMAHVASSGRHTLAEIEAALDVGRPVTLDPAWEASLGRVIALQNYDEADRRRGRALLASALPRLPKDTPASYRKLLIELHLSEYDYTEAKRLLKRTPTGAMPICEHLETDLFNPFVGSPLADERAWHRRFSTYFSQAGVEPFTVRPGAEPALDRLATDAPPSSIDGPLVSVLVTTFKPEAVALETSVRSIINQTWSNIEILILDDCSPPEYDSILSQVANLDPRIKLVKLEKNGGTYLARNAGIAMASGEYATCQDADDWSHPQRLELQVEPLVADPSLPATRSMCIAVQDELQLNRPGYHPLRDNASSLMFRVDDARHVGGFMGARRAADSELHFRLEAYYGSRSVTVKAPLALIRILPDSLSRSDFRAGWNHPARRAFINSYKLWHAEAHRDQLHASASGPGSARIPTRFEVQRQEKTFDVVLAADWRVTGQAQASMREEISALVDAGLKVGILHIEAFSFATKSRVIIPRPVQKLVNDGVVDQIMMDDSHTVRLLILRYPPILEFGPRLPAGLDVEQMLIMANVPPIGGHQPKAPYDPSRCAKEATRLFGVTPRWVAQTEQIQRALLEMLPDGDVEPSIFPGLVRVQEWGEGRSAPRSRTPVMGRFARDHPASWDLNADQARLAFPVDGSVDVRFLGGTSTVRRILGRTSVPAGWVDFEPGDIETRAFMHSLDFYIDHGGDIERAFDRNVLEAAAAGCIVIAPHRHEKYLGNCALYCDIDEVEALVSRLWLDRDARIHQLTMARETLSAEFSHTRFAEFVRRTLKSEALHAVGTGTLLASAGQ